MARLTVCARDELAPVALDAYPEAYEEFKVCLQLLVYTKELQRQQHETLRNVCGQAGRSQLAAAVYHAAMQALGKLVQTRGPECPWTLLSLTCLHIDLHTFSMKAHDLRRPAWPFAALLQSSC